ncbi:hypothetical protein BASA81_015305 [Batrachochytrium salamandrivorans]|nr:hypothetical protein BASA81_015305 [Batrachochytrium salamandrivorans]
MLLLLILLYAATGTISADLPVAEEVSLSTTTIYGFGTDFSARVFHDLTFEYGLAVKNNADVVYTSVPLEGIRCGYEGNTNEDCASLFHLYNDPGLRLDFDGNRGRRLTQLSADLEIDFAISPEPMITTVQDVQNFPVFVYGVAPVFNLPGVTKLVLTRLTLAKIFRGCDPGTFADCLPDSITMWNDSAILASNPTSIHPQLHAAGMIKVFIPAQSSPTMYAFKEALSSFDPDFHQQVGQSNDASWNGTGFQTVAGNYGVLRRVSKTPNSLSFDNIHQILLEGNVYAASLVDDEGNVLKPDTKSLYAALHEVGLAFGNDGRSASMLTVDLTKAKGIHSWPIALIGYMSTRTDYTPINCQKRKLSVLSFLEFIYTNQGEDNDMFDQGLAALTHGAGEELLDKLRSSLKCDGVQVYVPPPTPPSLVAYVDESLQALLRTFLRDVESKNEVHVELMDLPTHNTLKEAWKCASTSSCLSNNDLIVLADENLSQYITNDVKAHGANYQLFSMPYLSVATGFIYNFCKSTTTACAYRSSHALVLDVTTAANILDGNIVWWNDTAIAALNPNRNLPQERILVLAGPKYSSYHLAFVQKVRNTYLPKFAYRLGDEEKRNTFFEAWMDVALNPYSISFVVLNGTTVEGVEKISLRNELGVDVAASPDSLEACAMDTYDADNHLFHLSESEQPDCYPLASTFTLFLANPLQHVYAAQLASLLYKDSLRTGQGKTGMSASGFGTLTDLVTLGGTNLAQMNFDALETILLAGSGESILRVQHELNLIPQGAIQAMYAVMGLELALFLGLAIWTVIHRNRKLIRNSSPLFMLQVLFGAMVMACTVIPLAQQDDYLVPRAVTVEELVMSTPMLDVACVANPILFSIGFFITFSAMFLKSWRLIRIFNNAKLKNLFLRDRQLMLYQVAVIVIGVALNAIWAGVDPMVWERGMRYSNEDGLVIGSAGICVSRTGLGPAIPLIVGILTILVVGNYLAYLGRRIPTEFNESKWTAMAMTMILEAFIIAVPVLAMSNNEPVSGFIIKALVSLLVPGATVGLIFVPKIMLAYGWGESKDDTNPWRFVRASDSSNNTRNSKQVAQQQAVLTQIVGTTTAQPLSSPSMSAALPVRPNPSHPSALGFPSPSKTTSEALSRILQDDPSRRKFRRFLKTLKMEENVRFWDAAVITKAETNETKRYAGTRAVVQSFVCDGAPFQVNLSSATKQALVSAYETDDKQALRDVAFFDCAMAEMFDDLKQSDAFRAFMTQDTFSTTNLA